MAVWIPGRKLRTTFGERFAPFNYGKNGKVFPSIATFTGNWGASSPSARSWTRGTTGYPTGAVSAPTRPNNPRRQDQFRVTARAT